MLKEGSATVYAGQDLTIGQGSLGKVLVLTGSAAHVQWLDGASEGRVDLVDFYDLAAPLVTASTQEVVAAQFEGSIDLPSDSEFVCEAMDNYGVDGVLAALEEAGQLAVLAPYATEALGRLSASLRSDAGLSEALSGLGESERESVLSRIALNLLEDEDEGFS